MLRKMFGTGSGRISADENVTGNYRVRAEENVWNWDWKGKC